jgi:hypothetical protein
MHKVGLHVKMSSMVNAMSSHIPEAVAGLGRLEVIQWENIISIISPLEKPRATTPTTPQIIFCPYSP